MLEEQECGFSLKLLFVQRFAPTLTRDFVSLEQGPDGGREGLLSEVLHRGGGSQGEAGGPAVGSTRTVRVRDPHVRPRSLLLPTRVQREEEAETPCLRYVAGGGWGGAHSCPLSWKADHLTKHTDWDRFWWASPGLTKEYSGGFAFFCCSNNAVVNLCRLVFFVVFLFGGHCCW